MELDNAVVLVTGAARGVGRAIVEMFVAEGAKVAMIDLLAEQLRQTADELASHQATVFPIVTDITIPAQVEAMAEQVHQTE